MQPNDQARQELLQTVAGLSDEDLNRKPADDRWSIKQVMEHLYLMEGAIAKTISHQLKNGETVNAEAKPIEATTNRDVKVVAPDFATPTGDFATLAELEQKLAASHDMLKQVAEEADEADLEAKAYPHPVFGPMSLKQWIPFVGYHEMRHTAQIEEVKEQLGL